MFKSMAARVATTTGDFPKIVVTHAGKEARESDTCVIPIPRATERP